MKVNSKVKPVEFSGENGERFEMRRSNMGEPYRDGVDFSINDGYSYTSAFLEVRELKAMRDFLDDYLQDK
jgi:hypothetical protein